MEESLALFRVILSSDYFRNASIILFLNKTDLFPERLADKPLRCTYPEFDGNFDHRTVRLWSISIFVFYPWFIGADNDVDAAKEFIKNKYLNVIPTIENMKRVIYPHFTCSVGEYLFFVTLSINLFGLNLDSKNIEIIFNEIKDRIFEDIIFSSLFI